MALVSITPPAGVYANGTLAQAKGRWRDANLARFQEGEVKPVGGWRTRSAAAPFAGAARALLSWRDNGSNRWIAVGTSAKLYVQTEAGENLDITPAGYAAGRPDAAQNVGYGAGDFGADAYGAPPPSTTPYLPASVWSLDSWGEDLVGCCDTDGKIYLWALDRAVPAQPVANAPTGCQGLVATDDGFLMALGAAGDLRKVAWCDQQNITRWAADATNQAGDYDLTTVGTLQCGKAVPGGALIFTDVDVWQASYIGAPLVYGFERKGSGCGPISKGAVSARDSIAVWMGRGGAFWLFDGQGVQPLDCDVQDWVSRMNADQVSKVTAVHLADQGEVWWFFPSEGSIENDRYVAWAYRESQRLGRNVWTLGYLSRTAGSGRGVYPNPLMVDASGVLHEHELGWDYDGGSPYLETGPFEIGLGDRMAEAQRLVPDIAISDMALGGMTATFYGRCLPNGAETAHGPFAVTPRTDVLFQAALIRMRLTSLIQGDWRLGDIRLDLEPGDPVL